MISKGMTINYICIIIIDFRWKIKWKTFNQTKHKRLHESVFLSEFLLDQISNLTVKLYQQDQKRANSKPKMKREKSKQVASLSLPNPSRVSCLLFLVEIIKTVTPVHISVSKQSLRPTADTSEHVSYTKIHFL